MFLAGLLRMTEISQAMLDERLAAVMPELAGSVRLVRRQVNHIGGWHTEVSLPHQHTHRTLADITALIAQSGMDENAKRLATGTFTLLARAEAVVHEKKPEEVHFHEVGALDSILDICMTCELFSLLAPSRLVVSPLPLADGSVFCAHGVIPVPAPAMLELLEGVPVRPFRGRGKRLRPRPWPCCARLALFSVPGPPMRVEKGLLSTGRESLPTPQWCCFRLGSAGRRRRK